MTEFVGEPRGSGPEARVGERLDTVAGERTRRGEEAALVEAIAGLVDRAMDHPWSADQVRDALASPRACLVCDEDEQARLRGVVLGRRVDRAVVEIDLVAVDPDHRRAGIGRGMLEALMAVEREGGVAEFRLELAASNAAAFALYGSVGFVVVGRRARYYPDGDDALLLTWTAEDAAESAGASERSGD